MTRLDAHLDIPADVLAPDANSTLAELPDHLVIQLFVDRAVAGSPRFTMTEEQVEPFVDTCGRLDGIRSVLHWRQPDNQALSPCSRVV